MQVDMLKNAPHGAFALDGASTPIVFLAGGIGVVPTYSMIKQALHDGSRRRLTLLYSNRTVEDAPFLDELANRAAAHDNFHFAPTLTGAGLPSEWKGETGRISLEMIRRYVADHSEPAFYISGLRTWWRPSTQHLSILALRRRRSTPKNSGRSRPPDR